MSERRTGWWIVKTQWGDTFPAYCGDDGRMDVPTFHYDRPLTVEHCELEFVCFVPLHLMVAAPELLAACQAALDYFNETRSGREWRDNGGEEPDLLRAAINKAEGRGE